MYNLPITFLPRFPTIALVHCGFHFGMFWYTKKRNYKTDTVPVNLLRGDVNHYFTTIYKSDIAKTTLNGVSQEILKMYLYNDCFKVSNYLQTRNAKWQM